MSSRPSAAPGLPAELPPSRCQQIIERVALLGVLLLMFSLDLPPGVRLSGLLVLAVVALRWDTAPATLHLFHDEGLGLSLRAGAEPAVALSGCRLHWLGRGLLLVRLCGVDGRSHTRLLCGGDLEAAPLRLLKRLSWPGARDLTLK
ncbi:MAG: hypothetical protein D6717_08795 [Gammaproteobacteria bacterium]|nr:MAG: hypothetical protein D6717_08795 [Gammaproteobacteria bacterium]